jgi:hypothetical protein
MDETLLYHYDPRQSNNQCSGGIAAHPDQIIPSAKFLWKIFLHDFFDSRIQTLHSLIYKRPNYQRGVLLISAGAFEGHFEVKTLRQIPKEFDLTRQCPGSPGTFNPKEPSLTGLPVS